MNNKASKNNKHVSCEFTRNKSDRERSSDENNKLIPSQLSCVNSRGESFIKRSQKNASSMINDEHIKKG